MGGGSPAVKNSINFYINSLSTGWNVNNLNNAAVISNVFFYQVLFGPKALFSLFLRMEKVPLVVGARRLIANAFFLLQNIEVLQLNIIVFMPFILTGICQQVT